MVSANWYLGKQCPLKGLLFIGHALIVLKMSHPVIRGALLSLMLSAGLCQERSVTCQLLCIHYQEVNKLWYLMVSANLHENVKYRSAPRSSGTSARTRIWRFARSRIFSVRVFKADQLPVQNNELQDICSHHITNMALTFLQLLGCFGQAMQKWASGEVSRCHNQGVTYILIIFRIFCNKKGEFVDNYHQTVATGSQKSSPARVWQVSKLF